MKKIFLFIVILAISINNITAQNLNYDHPSIDKSIGRQKEASSFKYINDNNWIQQAQQNILNTEYFFKRKINCPADSFCAANRRQQLRFNINPLGYNICTLNTSKPVSGSWKEQISFMAFKKGNDIAVAKGKFTVCEEKTRISYDYKNISIEYINNENGLRQNFIINYKPAGDGHVELLLHIDGTLVPVIKNNELQFNDERGKAVLYYRDMHVWDADHVPLNAVMQLRDNNILAITIDDKNAKYPITIDPLNQTPEWIGSADGILPTVINQLAVDAAYGFSVAGVGDVNGDGYDDVAIGAPGLIDVISGTGELASVGAVFVYYGSPAGLSSTPDAMLQPTTSVAGALFGYSIAGGDINGDGKNDIIVGAPMDKVSIAIGNGNTASGTVGKVYAFNGSTLATNTSPFLTIQLSGAGILENNINLSVNALFGFSVAVTEDLNGDNKKDIIVGAPLYAGIKQNILGNSILDVQSGGAFVFLTNAADNNVSLVKLEPVKKSLLGLGLLSDNINGLLFGYSVDGAGDYNGDGKPDVIASAPAGVDAGSVSALLTGKLLQGSVNVYYGTSNGISTNAAITLTATSGGLLSNLVGSIANVANLFGVSVKAVRNASGVRNGNILVGAPLGGAIVNVLSLQLKTGTVSVFKKQLNPPNGFILPDQTLSSPRNNNNVLQLIQSNLLFGYSIDNTLDLNCDGIADIIVGEPASSGAQLLNANIAGGAAYVYQGNADGTYQTTPAWTLTATEDALLGINATSLIGFSVAGAGHVKSAGLAPRVLVGTPSRTLDFGAGLLNLGNTIGNLFSLATAGNGIGKAYLSNAGLCSEIVLPVSLISLKGFYADGISHLICSAPQGNHIDHFELERSNDGENFTLVGKVYGSDISNTNFKLDDKTALQGNNYYRLKWMEVNGSVHYSNIVLLKISVKGIDIRSISPVPFIDKININILSEMNNVVSIKLFDITGEAILTQTRSILYGSSNILIDGLGKLSKGLYIIEVKCGEKTKTQKLIKE